MVFIKGRGGLYSQSRPAASRDGPLTKRPATKSSPKKKTESAPKATKAKAKSAAAREVSADEEPPEKSQASHPVRPAYDLSGPAPAEAIGLPAKVGALLGGGQKTLGIKNFRPGQAEAFEHLLAGEDLLAVMPTGSV